MDADNANVARSFGRRRRRNHPGGRQTKIEVKVSAAENDQLRAAADRAGVSVQRLMVTRALSAEATGGSVGRAELVAAWQQAVEMRNLLGALGNNMNQIARNANNTGQVPADFAPALDAVKRASEKVRATFGAVYDIRFPSPEDHQ